MGAVTRRGFLRGLMISAATVTVGLRMAHGSPKLGSNYTWDKVGEAYSYGIDKEKPWDVVIFDEKASDFVDPAELMMRARPTLDNIYAPKPSTVVPWNRVGEPLVECDVADPFVEGEMCAPIHPEGQTETWFKLDDRGYSDDEAYNEFDDDTDRAFTTVAAISMSQGMLGIRDEGGPGFNGPWKETQDEITEPRIITTSRAYYEELGRE